MRFCLARGCALSLLLLVLLAGGGYYWWRTHTIAPLKPAKPFSQLPAAEQRRRRAEVKSLKKQIEQIHTSARRHEHKSFELVVSNDELNTLLQDSLSSKNYQVRDVQVEIQSGQVVMQGKVKYHGFDSEVRVAGSIEVEEGKLVFQAKSLTIHDVPVPGDWKNKVESTVTKRLNQQLSAAGVHVEEVITEQGKMTIRGVTD